DAATPAVRASRTVPAVWDASGPGWSSDQASRTVPAVWDASGPGWSVAGAAAAAGLKSRAGRTCW
ncbi:hypothetical protein ABZ646_05940, partial [Streptomyces sp. NPDC007162]|uniref:hypothetical protein n=1 Tax=Streptomyces sp. NPDC007162 TaxID=3156917 RepID=UPI0034074FBE